MNRVEKTIDLHMNQGLNCAQAILTVYGAPAGISPETAKTMGRTFGGGIAGHGLTCGYILGGMLALAASLNTKDEKEARRNTHTAVMELFRRFEEKHGTTLCKDLLGADLSTEKGRTKIHEEKRIPKRCPGFGRDVAEVLEKLIPKETNVLNP